MLPDPLRLTIALLPVASYCLMLGILNARRKPFITTGGADLATLGVALSGMVFIGPIELFRPEAASVEFGGYVWLFLLLLYGLGIWLTMLLSRPRLIIYNISSEELRPVLSEAARSLDPQARWAGDSLSLPTVGIQLHLETFEIMRNVSLVASGAKQNLTSWRQLAGLLGARLDSLSVDSNPRWLGIVLFAILLLATSMIHMLNHPQQIAQAMQEIFSY
ncbi:hypothetical protein [Bythopirellula polymerisocia]|uniref:Uncharacterized protein n=1 Tax=Bythopirellula polymerisocia TaxID=2528003 RepID=A0A5C6CMI5_9BACT|nr:hypothetical protein [Bythopirellula polymerisocia]TWU25618.1 hypothetical protein Pla144_28260 [Bythopirellula polymerisocia]